jgi:hypothetical protein
LNFFKKIKDLFETPDKAPTHGDWFYHTKLLSRKLIIFYKQIASSKNSTALFKTGEPILPPELTFNVTIDHVKNTWGKPRCSFNNKKTDTNIQVFFYRRNYVYENTLIQLQFFNQQLFFACIEVGKSMMNEETKLKMLNNILPNFITSNFKSTKEIPIFTDTDNNYLLIEDEINLNICFIAGTFSNEQLSILEQALDKANNHFESDL